MRKLKFRSLALLGALSICQFPSAGAAERPKNLFTNSGFEMGREGWQLDKAGKTMARYSVDEKDAAEGKTSALVTVDSIDSWGVQFGQHFSAGQKGKSFTFAAFARSTGEPIEVGLQIERSADPWDRVVNQKFKLTGEWQELHVTFKVEKDYPQGWFAYVDCMQPKAQFRTDMFRLYEGDYVPFKELAKEELKEVAVRTFDTGISSAVPLNDDAWSRRSGWNELPEDDASHVFKGDAVLMNDRVALVLRRGARGAEVYSMGAGPPIVRTVLAPSTSGRAAPADRLTSFTMVETNASVGIADAVFTTAQNEQLTLRYELKVGQPVIQTEARSAVTGLRVEAACRFAVVPDFFADDIVIDAAELPVAAADLPSDNLVLYLLPGGEAMVMTVAQTSEEDVRVELSGEGDKRIIRSSELRYAKDGKIWVAVLSGPSLWHVQEITTAQAGQVVRLPWRAPFQATWRTDWRRDGHLTDSWEMLTEKPDGTFEKTGLFGGPNVIPENRKRWTTVLGTFVYPCWIDQQGQGYLQPLKHSSLQFQGPAIIYPLNRAAATPLDTFTVLDILRNTLGVGPCEYVLDVEGQQSQYKGQATCAVRDALNPIYAKNEQVKRRAEVEKALDDLIIFIRHIRGRIEGYVNFGHDALDYLADQKRAHPELAEQVAELEKAARLIDAKLALRKIQIKTPADVAGMITEFRKTVLDYEGGDALARCRRFTAGWVDIGGNQDELVGECRWAVKMLRQRAGLLMATDPRMAEMGKEIRRRSQIVLRNPAVHEGARH